MSLLKSHPIIFLLRSHAEKFVVNCNSFTCILKQLSWPKEVLVGRGSENELKRRQNKSGGGIASQKMGQPAMFRIILEPKYLFQKLVSFSVVLLFGSL